jgi:hypothetical protein
VNTDDPRWGNGVEHEPYPDEGSETGQAMTRRMSDMRIKEVAELLATWTPRGEVEILRKKRMQQLYHEAITARYAEKLYRDLYDGAAKGTPKWTHAEHHHEQNVIQFPDRRV